MKICSQCEAINADGAQFCCKCDAPLGASSHGGQQRGSYKPQESSQPIPQSITVPNNITIHGYTQWFAINPEVNVYVNGRLVGKVGKDGLLQVQILSPCQIKFVCSIRSAVINVDPSQDSDIYISWDRVSGCLLANKFNSNNGGLDKPNIGLDILSFLIPIVGLILYFVKKGEFPNSAKSYLICALCGFFLNLFFELMFFFGLML